MTGKQEVQNKPSAIPTLLFFTLSPPHPKSTVEEEDKEDPITGERGCLLIIEEDLFAYVELAT